MKNFLKKILVPMLASRPAAALGSRLFGSGIPIFMLHRIGHDENPGSEPTPAYLRRCLSYLVRHGFQFVSLGEISAFLDGAADLPAKPVAFTMDDGYLDQAELAAPVFIEFNCPVTIFVVTGMMDGKLWPWFNQVEYLVNNAQSAVLHIELPDGMRSYPLGSPEARIRATRSLLKQLKTLHPCLVGGILDGLSKAAMVGIPRTPPAQYHSITWDQARELESRGVSFGPHTVSHPILSTLGDEESSDEIRHSWLRLREELAAPCPVFCYPNGTLADFGEREIAVVQAAGMRAAVSVIPGYVENRSLQANDPYKLPRLVLPVSFNDFLQYCSWIEYAKMSFRR